MFSCKSSFCLSSVPNSQKGYVSLCQLQQHLEASYPAPSSSRLLSALLPGPPSHRCYQLVYFWHVPNHIGSKHNKAWLIGRWKHLPLWADSAMGLNQGQNLAKGTGFSFVFCSLRNQVLSLKQQKQQNMEELPGTESKYWAVLFSEITCFW